jgi:CheY-like chemotaxis protein
VTSTDFARPRKPGKPDRRPPRPRTAAAELPILVGVGASAGGLEASGKQPRRSAVALKERTSDAERATSRLRDLAREVNRAEQKERRRIARLLHDDLQQLLISAKMRLGVVRPGEARPAQMDEVAALLDAAINSSRSLTSQLSPPVLQDAGLEAGLRWLARSIQEKQALAVDLDLALGFEKIDSSDSDFLFQAAREMLFNVVKHAGVRKAALQATLEDRHVSLEVSDCGKGFDPGVLDQEASALGDRLGLRTLRERTLLLGGRFDLATGPRQGTRVRISVPLSDAGETAPAPETRVGPAPAPAPATAVSGLVRVLIADDHRVVREGLQSFLSRERWLEIVGQAADGREAVLMTRDLQPDVVIMDISMPELNGIEATRIITGENPHVRIIGLSMHQREDMAAAMLAAGAERYLTKGGLAEDLVQAVRELGGAVVSPGPREDRPGSRS